MQERRTISRLAEEFFFGVLGAVALNKVGGQNGAQEAGQDKSSPADGLKLFTFMKELATKDAKASECLFGRYLARAKKKERTYGDKTPYEDGDAERCAKALLSLHDSTSGEERERTFSSLAALSDEEFDAGIDFSATNPLLAKIMADGSSIGEKLGKDLKGLNEWLSKQPGYRPLPFKFGA